MYLESLTHEQVHLSDYTCSWSLCSRGDSSAEASAGGAEEGERSLH